MAIIGRIDEQKELESCLQSDKAEFVVLYGRRRVGKTYLVKEYFSNHFSFYVSGVNNTTNKVQLKNFMTSLEEYGLKEKRKANDWLDAFQALKVLLEQDNVYREEKSVI